MAGFSHGFRRSRRGRWLGNFEPLESRRLLAVSPTLATAREDAERAAGGCPVCGAGGCSEHLGEDGTVMMACRYQPSAGSDTLAAAQPPLAVTSLADTFKLHSNPTATKVIYLDFDGHVTSKTAWQGGATFTTPAFSLDTAASFSDAEKRAIQDVWSRVAEDFIPFDIDVTTEEPAADDLKKAGTGDTRWGIRVVIGGDGNWMSGAAGVAYLNSFNWDSDTPCFVFGGQSWKANQNFMATCISHEVGHTLGLKHDGYNGAEYYGGRGTGETGWGPLMGNPGSVSLTQWSNGEYGGSTNKEDDLTIITTKNGFGYRADDHGNTVQTATAGAAGKITFSGTIGSNSDVDMFRFTTSGSIEAAINPIAFGTNLDILATLLDSSGKVVATSNPVDKVAASFTTTLQAGTYYIAVRGTGKGDINTTGYTAYGSLGQYTVSVTNDSSTLPSLSIADVTIAEGNSATSSATLTVSLSAAASEAVTVAYATANGTATTADKDYTAASGTLTFAAGETVKTFVILVNGDTKVENAERFTVRLSDPRGATIARAEAAVTLTNDDSPQQPKAVSLSINDIALDESNSGTTAAEFTVSLSEAALSPVTVWYQTGDGTATAADRDYLAATGTLTFLPGETTKQVRIAVTGDVKPEAAESFTVVLSSPTSAKIARARGTAVIRNDDTTGIQVLIADAAVKEGNSGERVLSFVVSLSAAARETVTLGIRTVDGTATAGADYTALARNIVFSKGMVKQTVTVWLKGDTAAETDETFAVELFDVVGATIGRGSAQGTIINDDTASPASAASMAVWAQLGQGAPAAPKPGVSRTR